MSELDIQEAPQTTAKGIEILWTDSFNKYLALSEYNDYNIIQQNTLEVLYEQGYFNTDSGGSGFKTIRYC
jgi:hypothetical protein